MAERVAEQIFDSGAEGKVFEQSMKRMLTDTFAINPIPQMIKPLVDLYANKDSFTGAPIETAGMERLSKDQAYCREDQPAGYRTVQGIQRIPARVHGGLSCAGRLCDQGVLWLAGRYGIVGISLRCAAVLKVCLPGQ
jgi:hypothetical protein